jgi:hypothetical protein
MDRRGLDAERAGAVRRESEGAVSSWPLRDLDDAHESDSTSEVRSIRRLPGVTFRLHVTTSEDGRGAVVCVDEQRRDDVRRELMAALGDRYQSVQLARDIAEWLRARFPERLLPENSP